MNKALGRMAVVLVWLGVVLLGADAGPTSPSQLTITSKDSGKTFSVTVGQRLTVDLHIEGGFQGMTPEFDPAILALLGQSLKSFTGPQGPGISVQVTYEFVVRKEGQTDLTILMKGSGEKIGQAKPYLKVKIVASPGKRI
jgi:hypothetical protein